MSHQVPYFDPNAQNQAIRDEILQAMADVYDSGAFILGPEVLAFEEEFSHFTQAKHTIAVNSGTSAVHLALQVLDIQPGDEVITTPFTFAASAWAISYLRATPVFVDIDPHNFNIDPKAIEAAITPKTKAILPVHLYGHPCDMDSIMAIANAHNLKVVEDAAQAHGALYKNRPIGSFGHTTAYSFFPTKNLPACGEAGAVTTNDDDLATHIRSLRNHGMTQRYHYDEVGYNYRMEALQGAILRIKLKYLKEHNAQRAQAAALYNSLLADIPEITLPERSSWATPVHHLYTIQANNKEALCNHLSSSNIGFSNHYPIPLHLQACYKSLNYKPGSLPVAEKIAKSVINLPLFPGITQGQIEYVTQTIKSLYTAAG